MLQNLQLQNYHLKNQNKLMYHHLLAFIIFSHQSLHHHKNMIMLTY